MWILLALLLFFAAMWYLARHKHRRLTNLDRAIKLHHADRPRARTALRRYTEAARQGYVQALLPMGQILEHGVPQGDEPVPPDPTAAYDVYMQATILGDIRDQAEARQRLQVMPPVTDQLHVAPRVVVAIHPDVVRREPHLDNPRRVPSDSQNVHDSSVVRHVKQSFEALPQALHGADEALEWTRGLIRTELGDGSKAKHAVEALDLVACNLVPLSSLQATELDVLRKVVSRIEMEGDPDKQKLMKDAYLRELVDIGSDKSCASGRVARLVDTFTLLDPKVNIKPAWALRREMLDKAALLAKDAADASDDSLKASLRQAFYKDYVESQLCTKEWIDAELESWGPLS